MAVLLLFFALPNALLLSASFLKSEAQQLTSELTLENYWFLFSKPLYLWAFIRTFIVGVSVGLIDVACVPMGAKNKNLAYEFLNWRLDPAIQREWALAYFSSPTRPGVELPAKFAASQLTTQEQLAKTQFPDSDVIGARRKDWTLKWQEIMA